MKFLAWHLCFYSLSNQNENNKKKKIYIVSPLLTIPNIVDICKLNFSSIESVILVAIEEHKSRLTSFSFDFDKKKKPKQMSIKQIDLNKYLIVTFTHYFTNKSYREKKFELIDVKTI